MVKLIASRLEGTFLDDTGQFDPVAFQRQLNVMQKRQIRFVVYSGLSYPELLTKFQSVNGPIDYIAENGAQVVQNGVNVAEHFVNPLVWDRALRWLKKKSDFGKFKIILSARSCSYTDLTPSDPQFKPLKQLYPALTPVPNLGLVGDPVYQVRLWVNQPNVNLLQQLFDQKFSRDLRAINGGKHCLYIVNRGVNLSQGLQKLQAITKTRIRQTAAFGRVKRDFNLLNSAKDSYFVRNGAPELANVAQPLKFTNNQRAVQKQITQILDTKE